MTSNFFDCDILLMNMKLTICDILFHENEMTSNFSIRDSILNIYDIIGLYFFPGFDNSFPIIFVRSWYRNLKVESCKLHSKKYMIASTQITNNEIFAFIAVFFKLLSRKFLFINKKDNRNY